MGLSSQAFSPTRGLPTMMIIILSRLYQQLMLIEQSDRRRELHQEMLVSVIIRKTFTYLKMQIDFLYL